MHYKPHSVYKTCPQCKKKFYVEVPELWALKDGSERLYCSWTCLQASRKKEPKRIREKDKPWTSPRVEINKMVLLWAVKEAGTTLTTVSKQMGKSGAYLVQQTMPGRKVSAEDYKKLCDILEVDERLLKKGNG